MSDKLTIVPCTLAEANSFVSQYHRHHKPVAGHKFSIAVADDSGSIRGVAIIGRPVARRLDDGWTLEVNRVATDGAKNACSALYGAARRAAFALGYRKLITYTLPEEGGYRFGPAGGSVLGRRVEEVGTASPAQEWIRHQLRSNSDGRRNERLP